LTLERLNGSDHEIGSIGILLRLFDLDFPARYLAELRCGLADEDIAMSEHETAAIVGAEHREENRLPRACGRNAEGRFFGLELDLDGAMLAVLIATRDERERLCRQLDEPLQAHERRS